MFIIKSLNLDGNLICRFGLVFVALFAEDVAELSIPVEVVDGVKILSVVKPELHFGVTFITLLDDTNDGVYGVSSINVV